MSTKKRGPRPARHPAQSILDRVAAHPMGAFDPSNDPRTRDQRARAHNAQYGTTKAAEPWPLQQGEPPETRVQELDRLHREGRLPDEGEGPEASMATSRQPKPRPQDPYRGRPGPTFADPPAGPSHVRGGERRGG